MLPGENNASNKDLLYIAIDASNLWEFRYTTTGTKVISLRTASGGTVYSFTPTTVSWLRNEPHCLIWTVSTEPDVNGKEHVLYGNGGVLGSAATYTPPVGVLTSSTINLKSGTGLSLGIEYVAFYDKTLTAEQAALVNIALNGTLNLGTNYYVKNGGDDEAAGTSDATAWGTLAKVSASTFELGDHIYLARGSMWRETLTVPSSGITIDAYGTGDRPEIRGSAILTDFTNDNGTVYKKTVTLYSATDISNCVYYNLSRLTLDRDKTITLEVGTWNYELGVLWINVGEDPVTHDIEYGDKAYGVVVEYLANVKLKNLTLKNQNVYSIWLRGGGSHTIDSIYIEDAGRENGNTGMFYIGSTNPLITRCYAHNIWGDVVYVYGVANARIIGNEFHAGFGIARSMDIIQMVGCSNYLIAWNITDMTGSNNNKQSITVGWNGVTPSGAGVGVIRGNRVKGPQSGIVITESSVICERNYITGQPGPAGWGGIGIITNEDVLQNVIIRNNIIENDLNGITFYPWGTDQIRNIKIYNNTIIGATLRGFQIDGLADSYFKNNIVTGSVANIFRVYGLDGSIYSDYNLLSPEQASAYYYWDAQYSTLAAYQAGKSQDAHSYNTNGNLIEYKPIAPSDAIGNGETLEEVTEDFYGRVRTLPYDIGAVKS